MEKKLKAIMCREHKSGMKGVPIERSSMNQIPKSLVGSRGGNE